MLDLPILAGPKDFHPGEAQGASVARTMSEYIITGGRAEHASGKEKKSCGVSRGSFTLGDFVQQNRHSTTPKTVSFHDEKSIILEK